MQNRSQETIINQINLFFKLAKRKQLFGATTSGGGYCHGLSLLWLYCIEHHEEEWFYNTVNNICSAKTLNDFRLFEKDLEKFIYHVEWIQNSNNYDDSMTQTHAEELLQTKLVDNLSYLFTHQQLEESLTKILAEKNMLAISGYNHTIAVYKRDDIFLLYDPNYQTGKHKEFTSIGDLKAEILCKLYPLHEYLLRKFPLVLNIFKSHQDKEYRQNYFFSLHQDIIHTTKNLNETGFQGKTDMVLAAENGNAQEIDLLVENGSDPNQKNVDSMTPLFLATLNNHPSAVKSLLAHHANPNTAFLNRYTALMCATSYELESIVEELLEHDANLLFECEKKTTAITIALTKHYWKIAIMMLSRITSLAMLNDIDIALIRDNIEPLKRILDKHPEGLTLLQKGQCENLLDQVQTACSAQRNTL